MFLALPILSCAVAMGPHPQEEGPLLASIPGDALAVFELKDPLAAYEQVLGGSAWREARNGPLHERIRTDPQFAMAKMGLEAALRAAGATDLGDLIASLMGGGAVGALLPPAEDDAEPGFLLALRGHDLDLAQDGLNAALLLAPEAGVRLEGADWRVPLGEAFARRRGSTLLLASREELLEIEPDAGSSIAARGAFRAARRRNAGASAWLWLDRRLLELEGAYPNKPEDLGASLFFGDLHEALRTAECASVALEISTARWDLVGRVPARHGLRETHQPFFPPVESVRMPVLEDRIGTWVLARDLGPWWTSRDLFMSDAAVAESVEADGNLSLLFSADIGPEVLHHLEPVTRVVIARNPERPALELELPGLAFGWQLEEDAPENLGESFVTAFLAGVTIGKFDGAMNADETLLLDTRSLEGGGKLYTTHYRERSGEAPAPLRFNLTPALALLENGEIWLASNSPLLESILEAQWEEVAVHGDRLELRVPPAMPIFDADREALIAQRVLEEGGDEAEAESFFAGLRSSLEVLEGLRLERSSLEDWMELRLSVLFRDAEEDDERVR